MNEEVVERLGTTYWITPVATAADAEVGPYAASYALCLVPRHGGSSSKEGRCAMCSYVRTLATIVGSEEEAERKIYRIECGGRLFGFGATIDEETANKLNGLPGVLNVFPENRSLKLDWEWFKCEFDEE
ncbi:hypothetical protein IFM89_018676 [Coptis chinensis]|uniref:MORF/ORRM1/DAG-like MORF domain-containing protein n=1 Tax=Coptis chinensis TaxID=261450 RepID=A0A835I547_9MAGN|nr:hypothetical protein IFM89_018676 [Coptis chinensis]